MMHHNHSHHGPMCGPRRMRKIGHAKRRMMKRHVMHAMSNCGPMSFRKPMHAMSYCGPMSFRKPMHAHGGRGHGHPMHAHDGFSHKEDNMPQDENTKLLLAVKSLLRAVERSIATETYNGIAGTMADNYHKLHAKIVALHPDDDYVTDVLALDVPESADDRQTVSLVQLAASQMVTYLGSLDAEESWPPFGPPHRRNRGPRHDFGDNRDFGRELSDEIMNFTRETLRRALAGIDVALELDEDEPSEKPKRGDKPKNDDSESA